MDEVLVETFSIDSSLRFEGFDGSGTIQKRSVVQEDRIVRETILGVVLEFGMGLSNNDSLYVMRVAIYCWARIEAVGCSTTD